jgi:hypothetical protein
MATSPVDRTSSPTAVSTPSMRTRFSGETRSPSRCPAAAPHDTGAQSAYLIALKLPPSRGDPCHRTAVRVRVVLRRFTRPARPACATGLGQSRETMGRMRPCIVGQCILSFQIVLNSTNPIELLKYIENGIKFRKIPNKFSWNPF